MDRFLTVPETASLLKVHPTTIYRWEKHGTIPSVRINRQIRFNQKEIEEWLEQCKRKAINIEKIIRYALTIPPPVVIDKAKGGQSRMTKKGQSCINYGFGRIYTRKTKAKCWRWYIDFWDANGRRVRKVVKHAISREQALVVLQDEVLKTFQKKTGVERKTERIKFCEFSRIYLQDYIMISRRNWQSDRYRLEKLESYFKGIELTRITPMMIERFRAERLKVGNSKSTINRYLALLKKLFTLAIEEGYVEDNPVKKVKFYSEEATVNVHELNDEEEAILLRECSERLRPLVVIALNTGMRRSEILGLKWTCVNLVKKTIRVDNAKSGKFRFIPINQIVFHELQRIKESSKSEFVFPYRSVRTAFENARKRAGLGGVRFHDLRHTFASRLIEKGIDVETVRSLLGHSSILVTQRYTHANDERKRKAVDLLSTKNAVSVARDRHTEKESNSENLLNLSFSLN